MTFELTRAYKRWLFNLPRGSQLTKGHYTRWNLITFFHVQSASLTIPIWTAGVHLSHDIAIFAPHKCIMGRRLLPFHEQINAAPTPAPDQNQTRDSAVVSSLPYTNHSRIILLITKIILFFLLTDSCMWRTVVEAIKITQLWCSSLQSVSCETNKFFFFIP